MPAFIHVTEHLTTQSGSQAEKRRAEQLNAVTRSDYTSSTRPR